MDDMNKDSHFKVIIGCQCLSEIEITVGSNRIVEVNTEKGLIQIRNPDDETSTNQIKTFTFQSVFDENTKEKQTYDENFHAIVQSVLEGYNGTIIAYGQTGSGKKQTMFGVKNNPEQRGLIYNSFEHIFQHILASENEQYLVRVAYLQLYNEDALDLLSKDKYKKLQIKEKPGVGVYVKDQLSFVVKNMTEVEHLLHQGQTNQLIWTTHMGTTSSKTSTILTVTIECCYLGHDSKDQIRVGKLTFVELAGSERPCKASAEGARPREGVLLLPNHNRSLCNVIMALTDEKSRHIPYRDSKLTRLIQDSLGGHTSTVLVAHISPASCNYHESLSTLRFASHAAKVKNQPKINLDPENSLIKQFQDEIHRLNARLQDIGTSGRKITESVEEESKCQKNIDIDAGEFIFDGTVVIFEQERPSSLGDKAISSKEQESTNKIQSGNVQIESDVKAALSAKITALQNKILRGGKSLNDS